MILINLEHKTSSSIEVPLHGCPSLKLNYLQTLLLYLQDRRYTWLLPWNQMKLNEKLALIYGTMVLQISTLAQYIFILIKFFNWFNERLPLNKLSWVILREWQPRLLFQ